ncbi:MAG TPA: hypothetical protein V6D29_02115 [Leptolyngbyaceae cyanobacterium]
MDLNQTVPPLDRSGVQVAPPMISVEERRFLGIFLDRLSLEAALSALKQTGFSMERLSILVKEDERHTLSSPLMQGSGEESSPETGSLLPSSINRVCLPETGIALMVGPDLDRLAAVTPDHTVHHDTEALQHLNIAEEPARLYSRHLRNGAYLVTMRGSREDVLPAALTLCQHGMRDWGIFDLEYKPQV